MKVKDADILRDAHRHQKMEEQNMFGNEVVKSGGGNPYLGFSHCQSLAWLTWEPAL